MSQAQDKVSLQMIGKVLNHSDIKTTQIYARLADDDARAALDNHADRVTSLAEWRKKKGVA